MHIIFVKNITSANETDLDYPVSKNRKKDSDILKLAKEFALVLKQDFTRIDRLYKSPDDSGKLFSETLSFELGHKAEDLVYLRSYNRFGLLSGVEVTTAKSKYPLLIKRLESNEYVPGSERYDDFIERQHLLLTHITESATTSNETILLFVDEYTLTILIEEFLGLIRNEIEEVAYLHCELENKTLSFINSTGITYITPHKG